MICDLYEERKRILSLAGFEVDELGGYSAKIMPIFGEARNDLPPIPIAWMFYSDGSIFYPSVGDNRELRRFQRRIRDSIPRFRADLGAICN